MKIQTEQNEQGLLVVRISGRIDPLTSPQLEEEFHRILSTGSPRMVVNLTEVTFISSTGLRVFLSALKNVKARRGDLKICGMDPNVEKIFKIAGFVSLFDILPTENEAIQKFGSEQK